MTVPTLPSRIESVLVYRNDAAITRVCEIDLSESPIPQEVQLVGLPLCLDDGSVTVKVEPVGTGGVPDACDVRVGLDVPPPDPELAPAKNEQLQEARRAVSEFDSQIEQLDRMALKLQELQAPDRPRGERGKEPPPAPTAARLALLEFRHNELENIGAQRKSLLSKIEEARDSLSVMEQRDEAASSSRQAREDELRKSVTVKLHSSNGKSLAPACRLVVEYLVPGARWLPSYAIRFNESDNAAELAMRAHVCQNTGEDWKNVMLRVATADPERWSELPELPALRIGKRQPHLPKTGWRPPPPGVDELFADYDRVAESVEPAEELLKKEATRSVSHEQYDVSDAAVLDDLDTEEQLTGAAPEDTGKYLASAMPAEPMAKFEEPVHPAPASAKPGFIAKAARFRGPPTASLDKSPDSLDDVIVGMAATPEERRELTAATDMLNYGRLRLGGVRGANRGTLTPVSKEQSYFEYAALVRASVDINVTIAIAMAERRARIVAEKAPPHGYAVPKQWEGFDFSYSAENAITVPSDSNFHNVPLSNHSGSVELRYVTVPREESEAYRFLDLSNPLQTPLPEGPADVYVNGDYLLTSRLHTVAPNGTIELGLGVEEGLKVARNTRFAERTSGLLKGNLGLSHEIAVDVTNNLSKDADVEVRERIPIAREGDDKVSVEVADVDPPWERFDQDRRQIEGAYHWRLNVPSGTTRTLKANYEITLSAKHEIAGGNRREE